ncbi:MAG: DNA repair protein RecO [Candidatus Doudnabacteria bacterium]
MRYKKLTGIILKKQNYREADQIVSVWTREAGKVRVLAKSLRKPASKLSYAMQDLSEAEIHCAGNHLPTLIGAKPIRQFKSLTQDLKKTAIAFYAAELMLNMTADEHPHRQAYDLLSDFLCQLDEQTVGGHYAFIDGFALALAQVLGFGVPKNAHSHRDVNQFMEHILERSVKSELFLMQI